MKCSYKSIRKDISKMNEGDMNEQITRELYLWPINPVGGTSTIQHLVIKKI